MESVEDRVAISLPATSIKHVLWECLKTTISARGTWITLADVNYHEQYSYYILCNWDPDRHEVRYRAQKFHDTLDQHSIRRFNQLATSVLQTQGFLLCEHVPPKVAYVHELTDWLLDKIVK